MQKSARHDKYSRTTTRVACTIKRARTSKLTLES